MNKLICCILFSSLSIFSTVGCAKIQPTTSSQQIAQLKDFDKNPAPVKTLIKNALALSDKHLVYRYNSADPRTGGLDCSGTIYYLMNKLNVHDVPRQANDIYSWAWKNGRLYAVNSKQLNSFEFDKLKPGDLLFWTGTYKVHREPPITHVMIYLGKNRHGQPLMFGASDGTFKNKKTWGVTVFDFRMPALTSKSRFVGYSCIPELTCTA